MEIIKTPFQDLLIIKPRIFEDSRGFFCEAYNKQAYKAAGIDFEFCQDNLSKSSYGVIRGLHYQLNPMSQTKLVSVFVGKVWDVVVDLRENSPTFKKWYGVELSEENHLQFLIPKGFAHGFSVLSENTLFTYKCDDYYNSSLERGIAYNDPELNIDWKIPEEAAVISDKDKMHHFFSEAEKNFEFVLK